MADTIRDGKGRGFLAEVGENNKLMTDCVMQTEGASIADLGYSFVVSSGIFALNSTNPHLFIYIKNTHRIKLIYNWFFYIGWNGGSTNHNRTLSWHWVALPNEPTANYTAISPANLNLTSNNIAEATVYGWDGVGDGMTYSGGNIATGSIIGQGGSYITTEGVPILGLSDSFGIMLAGEEIGDANITMRFFFK